MQPDPYRYDLWIEDALRAVVVRALDQAARTGLPGEHHFYITFRTHADGVRIPAYLKAVHKDEMTIVLQHQFWDLSVDDETLGVTLSFKGRNERLVIPIAAITAFADPSVSFGLQFNLSDAAGAVQGEAAATPAESAAADGLWAVEDVDLDSPPAGQPAEDGEDESAKVVALDAFRKK